MPRLIGIMEDGVGELTSHAGTRRRLKFKTVYAFAFNNGDPEFPEVVAHVCGYTKDDKAIVDFIARHSAKYSVGVFTGKSEWY